jgi:two-component system cell cycle sensor histidine kinase/response regulator CckA
MDGPRLDTGQTLSESRELAFAPGSTEEGFLTGSPVENLKTILVVDDIDLVREVLVAILKTANFAVMEANSGPNALEIAANYDGKIDLLFSDIRMPGMSGPDLAKSLRCSRPDLHILLTGGNFLERGDDYAFIQKPYLAAQLIDMVHSVLRTA